MHIGNIKITGKILLAPMCDVTNLPFRLFCKEQGAALVYTEMINCDAYLMENSKTKKRSKFIEKEKPLGIQIFGSSIENLKKAAVKIEKELKPDLIDINIGCPAYNVMKTGSGASLLNNSEKIKELIFNVSESLKIPLTCKIRILSDEKKTISIAKIIQKSGAKALTIHGRTAKQGYSGNANWEIVRQIKKVLNIPVILNGDIIDEYSASKAFETGCDALMIGRAAIGNPFIFKQINYFLDTGNNLEKMTFEQRLNDFSYYLKLCKKYGFVNIKAIKMQAQFFTKGFRGARIIRSEISKCKTMDEISKTLEKFSKNN